MLKKKRKGGWKIGRAGVMEEEVEDRRQDE